MGGGKVKSKFSRTIVLTGRTGNGKSATGNSILGKKAFESKPRSGGVTRTATCETTTLENGVIVKVIDTPGLFDFTVGTEFATKEIAKSIHLAEDGIHALILVFSVRVRFTEEEAATIQALRTFFGPKITEYMIVVFTGRDDLQDESLEEYLDYDCPKPLKEILQLCENRVVLFDNRTNDEKKKASQLQKLMTLIDKVIEDNDGQPYTNCLFFEIRKQKEEMNAFKGQTEQQLAEMMETIQKSCDDQLTRMLKMVEAKLKKIQEQLADEKAARRNTEELAQLARKQSENVIQNLRNQLEEAKKQSEIKIEELKKNSVKVGQDDGGSILQFSFSFSIW